MMTIEQKVEIQKANMPVALRGFLASLDSANFADVMGWVCSPIDPTVVRCAIIEIAVAAQERK